MAISKRNILILVSILFVATIKNAFAHPHHSPVRGTTLFESSDNRTDNFGGYGYVGTSEAEAYARFDFACSNEQVGEYYRCSSGLIYPWQDDPASMTSFVQRLYSPILLQRLREQMAEKIILEHAAFTPVASGASARRNWPASLPNCLQTTARATQLASLHQSLPAGMTPLKSLAAMNGAQRSNANKLNAMINANSSGNLIRAVMQHDQLNVRKEKFCPGSDGHSRNICADLTNQVNRIKESYPILFGTNDNPAPTSHLQSLHNAVYDVLGADTSGSETQRRQRGQMLYDSHTQIPSGAYAADEYKDFEAVVSTAVEQAYGASELPLFMRDTADSNQAEAFNNLNQSLESLQTNYRDNLAAELEAICTPAPGLSLQQIVQNHPNVVNQAMMDMSDSDQNMMRMVLCAESLVDDLAPLLQCGGITLGSNSTGEPQVSVDRTSSSWPYGSSNKYTITYPSGNVPPVIDMEINFPTSIRPRAEAHRYLDEFRTNIEGFYNCTGGNRPPQTFGPIRSGCLDFSDPTCTPDLVQTIPQMSCPPHPGMPPTRFNFKFTPQHLCQSGETAASDNCITSPASAAEPRMVLHHCYRAELSSPEDTDCAEVRNYSISTCANSTRRIVTTGRSVVNEDASEFDDYLNNIISPFAVTEPSNSSNRPPRNNCQKSNGTVIDNSTVDTSYCNSLSETASVAGQAFNCRQECLNAVTQCRMPSIQCWNDDMINSYCQGRLDRDTGRFDGPALTAGHPRFNRADSGNLTTSVDASTFIHEVGHILNLDDEYQDATYPFLPQGEEDSMMNGSAATDRFYPRHFNKMLEPVRCVGAP